MQPGTLCEASSIPVFGAKGKAIGIDQYTAK